MNTTFSRFAAVVGLGLLATIVVREFLPVEADAQPVVINVNVTSSGGRIAFTEDGGCTIAPECQTGTPLRCSGAPQPFNRGAQCSTARQAFTRAATADIGVSDGGAP